MRRLDNSFFRDLTGGLPSLTTNLERGNDGIVHFTNLQLYSPKLRLAGAGQRFRDGTFHIVASGRQAKYGPLRDGPRRPYRAAADRPVPRPSQRRARDPRDAPAADPTAAGFDYRASGGSKLGPFTSNGRDSAAAQRADGDRDRLARCRRRACERRPCVRTRAASAAG